MFVDANGDVGLGESNPQTVLHVVSAAAADAIRWTDNTNSTAFLGTTTAASTIYTNTSLVFGTGSAVLSEKARITSDGRLGLGTSSPKNLLHVNGTVNLGNPTQNQTSNNIILVDAQSDPADTNKAAINLGTTAGASSSDSFISFFTNKYGVSRAERVRINPEGRVGIGTTNPNQPLHVVGNARFTASLLWAGSGATNSYLDGNTTSLLKLGINDRDRIKLNATEITFNDATSEFARIDSSGRLGLGTSEPNYKLDVRGGNAAVINTGTDSIFYIGEGLGTSEYMEVGWTASTNTGRLTTTGTGALSLDTNSTSRLFIKNTGEVGIGTTDPNAPLCVNGLPPQAGIISAVAASGGRSLALSDNINCSLYVTHLAGGALLGTDSGNAIRFATNGFGSSDEKARIDSSGRLLVGTSTNTDNSLIQTFNNGVGITSFSADAFAYGNLIFTKSRGTTANSRTVVASGDELGGIYFQGADGTNYRYGASIRALVDGTPGANDMPGRLTFSTTADGASSPTPRMSISNLGFIPFYSQDSNVLYPCSSKAAGTSDNIIVGTYGATAVNTGTASFVVRTNGDVQNTNNSYGALSDFKLKENIVDANSQWNDLKALQVRKYNFKEGQTHTQIGLVAQEVELVSPGLVSESPDRDEDGNHLGTVTKSVNYSVLYMKAVKALQEAMERIEVLEQRLTDAGIA